MSAHGPATQDPVFEAFIEALRKATRFPVGDHVAPAEAFNGDGSFKTPYFVVYAGTAASPFTMPDFSDRKASAAWPIQVTAVNNTAQGARKLADEGRAHVLGRDPDKRWAMLVEPAGYRVVARDHDSTVGPDPSGSLVTVVDLYRFHVTPS